MATYFLRVKHVSRGKGARVTRAAAYRAGERIRDERTGEVHDYSTRRDVAHKEVVLPSDLAGRSDMAWTQDRATLWNAAEYAGLRRNSRLAREWLVLIPPELNPAQRVALVRGFAAELADKYRCAIDMCLHTPRPTADSRNHHAHLLMTTRVVTPDGLGGRTTLEMGGRERHRAGLGSTRDEYLILRERWAQVTNIALQQAGLSERIDHRSLERQGIDRDPVPNIPEKVLYAERKSGPNDAGEAIRARHRERTEARRVSRDEVAHVVAGQKAELRARAREDLEKREAEPKPIRWNALTRAERNAHRRERYEARRALERQDPALEARRREAARKNYHDRMRQNPEAVRESRRRWREAHADEVNRKQREYRHARAAYLPSKSTSTSPEQSAKNWRAYREKQAVGPTAEQAALGWLDLRKGHSPDQAAPSSQPGAARDQPDAVKTSGAGAPHLSPARGPDFGL